MKELAKAVLKLSTAKLSEVYENFVTEISGIVYVSFEDAIENVEILNALALELNYAPSWYVVESKRKIMRTNAYGGKDIKSTFMSYAVEKFETENEIIDADEIQSEELLTEVSE